MLLHFCHPKKVYRLLLLLLFCGTETTVHAQKVKRFNGSLYKLEKHLWQQGFAFLFWRGQTDSTTKNVVIERTGKGPGQPLPRTVIFISVFVRQKRCFYLFTFTFRFAILKALDCLFIV